MEEGGVRGEMHNDGTTEDIPHERPVTSTPLCSAWAVFAFWLMGQKKLNKLKKLKIAVFGGMC